MRNVFVAALIALSFSTAYAESFVGSWMIDRRECEKDGQPVAPCPTYALGIELSLKNSPETLCIKYIIGSGGGYQESCLNNFDYSHPSRGIVFKAELNINADKTEAQFVVTDANEFRREARSTMVEKLNTGYALTSLLLIMDPKSGGVISRTKDVYFLK